ncbi:hypothetical protein CEXT_522401 [Caerostris extrusa]|uniref:Uncharacterized protein n=1 Tax=Caerostris extrusa TaxID=172846 RepID=A0AAV4Q9J8_CAEEX|nr:hypothetical protein CEXT_522401 [Caerostris extrusa]
MHLNEKYLTELFSSFRFAVHLLFKNEAHSLFVFLVGLPNFNCWRERFIFGWHDRQHKECFRQNHGRRTKSDWPIFRTRIGNVRLSKLRERIVKFLEEKSDELSKRGQQEFDDAVKDLNILKNDPTATKEDYKQVLEKLKEESS